MSTSRLCRLASWTLTRRNSVVAIIPIPSNKSATRPGGRWPCRRLACAPPDLHSIRTPTGGVIKQEGPATIAPASCRGFSFGIADSALSSVCRLISCTRSGTSCALCRVALWRRPPSSIPANGRYAAQAPSRTAKIGSEAWYLATGRMPSQPAAMRRPWWQRGQQNSSLQTPRVEETQTVVAGS